jgi:hypothetical protein
MDWKEDRSMNTTTEKTAAGVPEELRNVIATAQAKFWRSTNAKVLAREAQCADAILAEVEAAGLKIVPAEEPRPASFYRPNEPDDGFMILMPCRILWESDPDYYGEFAVVFQQEDGTIWAASADMESHSLFFHPTFLLRPTVEGDPRKSR